MVVRPPKELMKKVRSVTIYPPTHIHILIQQHFKTCNKNNIYYEKLYPPSLYLRIPRWIRWFIFLQQLTFGSATREAMYLDGVGPNSSVDCFGFVTVQMTFNGLGLGVEGKKVVHPKRGGSRSLGGVLREPDLVWKEIFQENWVEWCLLVMLFFWFCLEREAYVGHQCVFCCMSVCFDVGYVCWIVEPLLIWKLVPARWSTPLSV